jgi:cardiolipin synthase
MMRALQGTRRAAVQAVPGNRITLYKNGGEYFPALLSALAAAQKEVWAETYIFESDTMGCQIADAFSDAARRGVKVHLLADGFGTRHVAPTLFEAMRAAGVSVHFFRPERGLFRLKKSRLRRLHRKIVVVDETVAFVGGINFLDDFNGSFSDTHPRYDYAVGVAGPVLASIVASVQSQWRTVDWLALRRLRGPIVGPFLPPLQDAAPRGVPTPEGQASLAFVARDNVKNRRAIERAYLAAIAAAKQDILIVSPYFLPGRHFRRALVNAAARGVRVRVLLQGRADHPLMQWATRALYPGMLAKNVELYEYDESMLHGKVAVVDTHWATVGSSNLDPFSLILNREANIVALDEPFARTLLYSVEEEITLRATKLDRDYWCEIAVWSRMKAWAAFMLSRVMAGMVGVRADY